MSHERIDQLYDAWRDGRLDVTERAELAALLRGDPGLRDYCAGLARVDRLLQVAARPGDASDLAARVLASASASGRRRVAGSVAEAIAGLPAPRQGLRLLPSRRVALAMAAALLVGVGLLRVAWSGTTERLEIQASAVDDEPRPGRVGAALARVVAQQGVVVAGSSRDRLAPLQGDSLALPCELQTAAGASLRLLLPDGSELHIGGSTACGISSQGGNLVLHRGSLRADCVDRARWIMTPQALAEIDGAALSVVAGGGTTRLRSERGSAIVRRLSDDRATGLEAGGRLLVGDTTTSGSTTRSDQGPTLGMR